MLTYAKPELMLEILPILNEKLHLSLAPSKPLSEVNESEYLDYLKSFSKKTYPLTIIANDL